MTLRKDGNNKASAACEICPVIGSTYPPAPPVDAKPKQACFAKYRMYLPRWAKRLESEFFFSFLLPLCSMRGISRPHPTISGSETGSRPNFTLPMQHGLLLEITKHVDKYNRLVQATILRPRRVICNGKDLLYSPGTNRLFASTLHLVVISSSILSILNTTSIVSSC